MKDLELADSFRSYFAALHDSRGALIFSGWLLHTGQSEEDFVFPDATKAVAVIFDSKSEPLAGSGSFFRASLTVTVESHSQDGTAASHGTRVEVVRAALFGSPSTEQATKAAVIAAVNALGAVRVLGYGADPNEVTFDSNRFKTTLVLSLGYSTV